MSSDRELLELAAKAAGIVVLRSRLDDQMHRDMLVKNGHRNPHHEFGAWNPLADDGDALRLLTKLPFRELYVSEIGVTVSWRRDEAGNGLKCDEYASEHGGDINAATRRAIVRAAAQIGSQP